MWAREKGAGRRVLPRPLCYSPSLLPQPRVWQGRPSPLTEAFMNFWKQFKPKSCIVNLKSSEKEGILTEIVTSLVKSEILPKEFEQDALDALTERETLGSTGVGMGVAIPHIKLKGLTRVACNVTVHKTGVEWSAIDGEPVHILFTVLRPDRAGDLHDPERHLEMMKWIAKLSREPDFRRFAKRAKTKTELVNLLKEMSAV